MLNELLIYQVVYWYSDTYIFQNSAQSFKADCIL